MIECSKASLLRCRNCKHVKCDKYKIMQILIRKRAGKKKKF